LPYERGVSPLTLPHETGFMGTPIARGFGRAKISSCSPLIYKRAKHKYY
jgi:hypothetical protein